MEHLISMQDLEQSELLNLMNLAKNIENKDVLIDLRGKLVALLFFEPSTRTRFSFEAAMKKLGGETFSMTGDQHYSTKKGETIKDTLKTISMYADLIVVRSAVEGMARYAAEIVDIPVINAGDGANQHPTQALLDLYSIQKTQQKLKNLKIAMVGDLKFGRTVHSLAQAMASFSPQLFFSSPSHLAMPKHIKNDLEKAGVHYQEQKDFDRNISQLDILYMTRIQKERFADPEDYERVKNTFILKRSMLQDVKPNFKIMHPLPRVNEIEKEVDNTPYAYYFQQAQNGMFIRQAVIAVLLKAVSL